MEGPKKNPDKLNTIGIVTVGCVGSALVYLSIVGLQAFYVNDTAAVDEQSKFGTQDKVRLSLKSDQMGNITDVKARGVAGEMNTPVYSINIADAKKLIVRDAKVDPGNLVPAVHRSDTATVKPIFGRPQPLDVVPPTPPATPPTDGAGAGTGSAAGAGTGSEAGAGAGTGTGSAAGSGAGTGSATTPAGVTPEGAGAGSGSGSGSGVLPPPTAPTAPTPEAPGSGSAHP